jgi:RNA polymerase sigma factor (TIGR02999 family)
MPDDSPITEHLHAWSDGNPEALEDLMALVYTELREMSRRHLRGDRRENTLNPTALVHEVYMRLVNLRKVSWENRARFFSFAATLMRRVIVDHARTARAKIRGGHIQHVTLNLEEPSGEMKGVDILDLERVLSKLEKDDPPLLRIIELRFFAGFTEEETAEVLGISRTQLQKDWKLGKLYLRRHLQEEK